VWFAPITKISPTRSADAAVVTTQVADVELTTTRQTALQLDPIRLEALHQVQASRPATAHQPDSAEHCATGRFPPFEPC
jgi:hypothetical protein